MEDDKSNGGTRDRSFAASGVVSDVGGDVGRSALSAADWRATFVRWWFFGEAIFCGLGVLLLLVATYGGLVSAQGAGLQEPHGPPGVNWIGVGCVIISLFLGIVFVVLGNSSGRGQRVRVWVFLPIAVHAILLALLLATTLWVIRWTGFPAGLAWCLPLGALALTVGVGAMVCLSCMLPADRVAVGSPRGTLVTAVLAGLGFAVALKLLAIPVFAADLAAAANVGRSAVCRANLHRIGIAILEYEAENRLYLPSGASGEPAALDRYFPSPPLRACPLEAESKNYIYVIDLLREVHRRKNGGDPTPVPWDFADGPGLFADPGNPHGSDQPRVRLKISLIPNMADAPLLWDRHPSHGGKIAVVAGDAHVMTLDPAELQKLLDDPKTGIAHWPAFVQDVPSR